MRFPLKLPSLEDESRIEDGGQTARFVSVSPTATRDPQLTNRSLLEDGEGPPERRGHSYSHLHTGQQGHQGHYGHSHSHSHGHGHGTSDDEQQHPHFDLLDRIREMHGGAGGNLDRFKRGQQGSERDESPLRSGMSGRKHGASGSMRYHSRTECQEVRKTRKLSVMPRLLRWLLGPLVHLPNEQAVQAYQMLVVTLRKGDRYLAADGLRYGFCQRRLLGRLHGQSRGAVTPLKWDEPMIPCVYVLCPWPHSSWRTRQDDCLSRIGASCYYI